MRGLYRPLGEGKMAFGCVFGGLLGVPRGWGAGWGCWRFCSFLAPPCFVVLFSVIL